MNKSINGYPLDSIRYTKTQSVMIDQDVLRDNRVIMGLNNDPRADLFRVLRTNVLKQLRENNWNSFAITSATPEAGKTFISVNLAIAIAMEGNQSVLLVDADLKCPKVGQCLGLEWEFGLVDCLNMGVSLEDTLINPGIERLVVLPGSNYNNNSSELISSRKMVNLIKEIKSRYESRIIIFDLPPLFAGDDALVFMPYVDAALLVIEDGKNTSEELQQSMYILEQTNLLGLVLNKSTQPLPTYQYGYVSEDG
jgi:capsular exopolysaccharide synthesis family protein